MEAGVLSCLEGGEAELSQTLTQRAAPQQQFQPKSRSVQMFPPSTFHLFLKL